MRPYRDSGPPRRAVDEDVLDLELHSFVDEPLGEGGGLSSKSGSAIFNSSAKSPSFSLTRARIIAATNELFRRQGYNGTSLKQISRTADATIGSIYHFFPGGKEALAVATIESTGAVYRELFEAIAAAAQDPVEAFADFFSGAAAVLEETDFIDPCPIGTVAREVANTNEPLRAAAAAAFDSWIDAATAPLVTASGTLGPLVAREIGEAGKALSS